MNHIELATLAEKLFGGQWQHPLARALGLNERTVRRWASGETPVPEWAEKWLIAATIPATSAEWILGSSVDGRRYLIRSQAPRFIGEIAASEPDYDDDPIAGFEDPLNGNPRYIGRLSPREVLYKINWIDLPPGRIEELEELFSMAAAAYRALNSNG